MSEMMKSVSITYGRREKSLKDVTIQYKVIITISLDLELLKASKDS